MLLTIDLYEDFVDIECVTIALVLSFQSSGVFSAELEAPQANCFAADSDTAFSWKIFNISMAVTTRPLPRIWGQVLRLATARIYGSQKARPDPICSDELWPLPKYQEMLFIK